MQINRRDFLRLSGVAVVGGATLSPAGAKALASSASQLAILYDSSKCVGCRACQMACKDWNELPGESTDSEGIYESPTHLSADTWTLISLAEHGDGHGDKNPNSSY